MLRNFVIVASIVLASAASAQERLALVVGIDEYQNVDDLRKATSDARAVSGVLENIGFEVITLLDADERRFNRQLADFTAAIDPGDEVVFYFAGHGIEIDGQNYLLPSDAPDSPSERVIRSDSINADEVLRDILRAGASVAVMILDACRDNPYASSGRSIGGARGLNIVAAPVGSFVLMSAGSGEVAYEGDDDDPNSIFTRALLPLLQDPGLALPDLARQLRRDVQLLASDLGYQQRPAYYDEVAGDYFFLLPQVHQFDPQSSDTVLGPDTVANPATIQPIVVPTVDPCATADLLWRTLATTTSTDALQSFIETYRSTCAPLAALANDRLTSLTVVSPVPAQPIGPPPATLQSSHPRPSWCPNAGTPTERAICNTATLSTLDIEMVQIYDYLMSIANSTSRSWLRSDQGAWLQRRDSCGGNASCIEYEYRVRIQRLQQL